MYVLHGDDKNSVVRCNTIMTLSALTITAQCLLIHTQIQIASKIRTNRTDNVSINLSCLSFKQSNDVVFCLSGQKQYNNNRDG